MNASLLAADRATHIRVVLTGMGLSFLVLGLVIVVH